MAKEQPRIPIEGTRRIALSSFTKQFSDALEESCDDFVCRVQVYSSENGDIWMKAIVFDEDGRQLPILFNMNPEERVLRASKKFKTSGKREITLKKLGQALVTYITNINTVSTKISNIFFDIGPKFTSCSYNHDPKEKGSIRVYLPCYKKDYCGITDMRDEVGAELANMC